jgi:uncharacterized membrane protein
VHAAHEVEEVSGVRDVDDELEVHEAAGNIRGLQGDGVQQRRFEFLRRSWAPAPRAMATAAGLGLTAYGVRRRDPLGIGAGLAGLALLLRGATNESLAGLLGIGAGRGAVEIEKDLHVDAAVEEVFDFWRRLENFPRFMRHVKDVRPVGAGRYRWTVEGPGGVPIQWDADITQMIQNEVLAWRSVPGATIRNAGIVRFERDAQGGTWLKIRMEYRPPAGKVGHAFAKLLGADPKNQMHEDLVRFKSLLEEGTTGSGPTVTRDEVQSGGPSD